MWTSFDRSNYGIYESYESYGYGHFIDGTGIMVVFIDSTSIMIVYETFPAPPTFLYRRRFTMRSIMSFLGYDGLWSNFRFSWWTGEL
jgi:hypothetical protein